MTAMIAEGLFRVDGDKTVLLGSRRRSRPVTKFPAEPADLFDDADDIEVVELSTTGTLFTFTTQEFPPPPPYIGPTEAPEFQPYVVGYVELPEGLLVESLIVGAAAAELRIGQPLETTTTTLRTADGESLLTFAFTPKNA